MTESDGAASSYVSATPLRIATWNLNHWRQPLLPTDTRRGAWEHLAGPMGVAVALVQEAVPPLEIARERHVFGELAGHRAWGSGVVALDAGVMVEPIRSVRMPWSKRRHRLDAAHPGSTAVARVTVAGLQPITLVSVYGVMEGSALISMHRIVADLLPLFDSPDGTRVVLGGDLNITQSSTDERYLARAQAVLDAIASLGLVEVKSVVAEPPPGHAECPCGGAPGCGHLGTWGRSELDHLYVSPVLAPQVAGLAVDASGVDAGLSDHVALVLDLALTAEPTPQAWDEEAFAVEVGRRHGPAARRAVEALVSWAEHKERELASAAGVTAKVLTRFPVSGGVTVEPELLLTLDLQTEPRASEVLCSIHAAGDVVIWLGGLKMSPFDTTGARHELRRALNAMDGVHLHRARVNGWPRFPLAALEKPQNLLAFVAVLDRIATESHAVTPAETARREAGADAAVTLAGSPATTGRGVTA